jgi:hypothetical protein
VFDAAPKSVHLDRLNIENVVPDELGGIVRRLELQSVPERLLKPPGVERKPGRGQGPERFRDEVSRTRERIVDLHASGPQRGAHGVPLERLDLVVTDGSEDILAGQRALGDEARLAGLVASGCRSRKGHAQAHRRTVLQIFEAQDDVGVGVLPGRLRPFALFIEGNHAETVVAQRPLAPYVALSARVEADAGHARPGEDGLHGVDDRRLTGAVGADDGGHPAHVDLLRPEQIPVDQDDATELDHAWTSFGT